jgi:hypothetical protein
MGGTENGKVAVFRLKMRGIAGIPLLALKDCGRLWNPSG